MGVIRTIFFKGTCSRNCEMFPKLRTVQLQGLPEKQADRKIELKGPPAAIAKDAKNNWSKAAQGFAGKNGVSVDNLEIREF